MLSSKLSNINATVNDASAMSRMLKKRGAPAGFGEDETAVQGQHSMMSFLHKDGDLTDASLDANASIIEDAIQYVDADGHYAAGAFKFVAPPSLSLTSSTGPRPNPQKREGATVNVIEILDDSSDSEPDSRSSTGTTKVINSRFPTKRPFPDGTIDLVDSD